VLMFMWPEKYYSCWLFWNGDTSQFGCYYVNFQLPYLRSRTGFDTLDLDLDIVVNPDYTWAWKDEDEYQEGIADGGIRAEWVERIEQSQPEVFEMIRARSRPMDGSWINWKPDPAWYAPALPAGWHVI
jgi:protein associated with RNAse G/E